MLAPVADGKSHIRHCIFKAYDALVGNTRHAAREQPTPDLGITRDVACKDLNFIIEPRIEKTSQETPCQRVKSYKDGSTAKGLSGEFAIVMVRDLYGLRSSTCWSA
jgi:hypothetical protein